MFHTAYWCTALCVRLPSSDIPYFTLQIGPQYFVWVCVVLTYHISHCILVHSTLCEFVQFHHFMPSHRILVDSTLYEFVQFWHAMPSHWQCVMTSCGFELSYCNTGIQSYSPLVTEDRLKLCWYAKLKITRFTPLSWQTNPKCNAWMMSLAGFRHIQLRLPSCFF